MNEAANTFQRFCPQCGGMVDADARFCKHCAFDLSKSAPESDATIVTTKPAQKSRPNPIALIMVVAITGLLLLGLLGLYLYKKRNVVSSDVTTSSSTPAPTPIMSDNAIQIEEKILRGETLNESDIAGLSAYELRILRNVHFARYGRKYEKNADLSAYFSGRPWYKPRDDYSDSMITATDKANINLIREIEDRLKGGEVASTTNSSSTTNSEASNSYNSRPASTPESSTRVPISVFRNLRTTSGDEFFGYGGMNQATTLNQVIARFGRPIKSESVETINHHKLLYYYSTDEFGNPCFARLGFVCGKGASASDLGCFVLTNVDVVSQ